MAQRSTISQRVVNLGDPYSWGRANRRKSATAFYGDPQLKSKSGFEIQGIAELTNALMQLDIELSNLRPTHLRAAVKVEYAALKEVPVARGPEAYWRRPASNPKPPAGGLKRSIRSFATDEFGEVDAGGGGGAQRVGTSQPRSMTGEFARSVGQRGQRTRTLGGKGSVSAKNLSMSVLEQSGGRSAQYAAGKGNVPYAGAIHFGWTGGKRRGRPIKANPFLWRAYTKKRTEVVRVYEIDFKKLVKKVGLK